MSDTPTKTPEDIKNLQQMLKERGFDPGPIDGIPGPRTEAAWLAFEEAREKDEQRSHAFTATNWPRQREVPNYFGAIEIGKDGLPTERWQNRFLTQIRLPYPMRLSWDHDTVVRSITCHKSVARDLSNILGEILEYYGSVAAVKEARMDLYGGCYNFRRMRGGSNLSMHSYGIAIDIDPERNPLGRKWEPDKGMMPEAVIAIFKRHGWTWGGDWKSPADPQHFQAAKL